MRTPFWVGIVLIVCAPFPLLIGTLSGSFLRNLSEPFASLANTIQIVIVSLVPAMLMQGASLVWLGLKPDEQELKRKEDVFQAIKRWSETRFGGFRDKNDTLPLAEKAPELATEIDKCLSHYPSIYADLQKLRHEYREWKDTQTAERFTRVEKGKTIIDLRLVNSYDNDMCRRLLQSHHQLMRQIQSEILDKHYTTLKL
jgi:hypothetical protein